MPNTHETSLRRAAMALLLLGSCADVPDGQDERTLAQVAAMADAQQPPAPSVDAGARPGTVDGAVASHDHDHAHPGSDDNCPADYPNYREGLSTEVGGIRVTLVAADPIPPLQGGGNDFTFALTDAATGAALSSATVLLADTWMPFHNHGGRWTPDIEPLGDGRFLLRDLDFKMRGANLVRFSVKKDAAAPLLGVNFRICAE